MPAMRDTRYMNKLFVAKRVSSRILHIRYHRSSDMARDFMRFQEYYESPKFKGRFFTRTEFNEWYRRKAKKGRCTYSTDWGGFNLPSWVFRVWENRSLDPREAKLAHTVRALMGNLSQFPGPTSAYVIATAGNDEDEHTTYYHELAHALFATESGYREKVLRVLEHEDGNPALEKVKRLVKRWGYHPDVVPDECHAYVFANMNFLKSEGVKIGELQTMHANLSLLFWNYLLSVDHREAA